MMILTEPKNYPKDQMHYSAQCRGARLVKSSYSTTIMIYQYPHGNIRNDWMVDGRISANSRNVGVILSNG